MPYSPPAANAVNFNVQNAYTAPAFNAVNFDLALSGAQLFSQTLLATRSATASLTRRAGKLLRPTLGRNVILRRNVAVTQYSIRLVLAELHRLTPLSLIAFPVPTASMSIRVITTFHTTLTATLAALASLTNRVQLPRRATQGNLASNARRVIPTFKVAVSAVLSTTARLQRVIFHGDVVSETLNAIMDLLVTGANRLYLLTFTAHMLPSGTLRRNVFASVGAVLAPLGVVRRRTSHTVRGVLSSAASVSFNFRYSVVLSVSRHFVSSLVTKVVLPLTGKTLYNAITVLVRNAYEAGFVGRRHDPAAGTKRDEP